MDLLIRYRLAERRTSRPEPPRRQRESPPAPAPAPAAPRPASQPTPPALRYTDADVAGWHAALMKDEAAVHYVYRTRGWRAKTLVDLEIGLLRATPARPARGTRPAIPARPGRLTIPWRSGEGRLLGVQRYRPRHADKALNFFGSTHGIFPSPPPPGTREALLLEGPPDGIAARSHGLPAFATTGAEGAWDDTLAWYFIGLQTVYVLMDCDDAGRRAAQTIARALTGLVERVVILDLDPSRDDRYHLTDWVLEQLAAGHLITLATLLANCSVVPLQPLPDPTETP